MRLAVFEPVFRGELGDGLVGMVGDLGQHVLEVVEGIDAPLAAGLNDGEEDGPRWPQSAWPMMGGKSSRPDCA